MGPLSCWVGLSWNAPAARPRLVIHAEIDAEILPELLPVSEPGCAWPRAHSNRSLLPRKFRRQRNAGRAVSIAAPAPRCSALPYGSATANRRVRPHTRRWPHRDRPACRSRMPTPTSRPRRWPPTRFSCSVRLQVGYRAGMADSQSAAAALSLIHVPRKKAVARQAPVLARLHHRQAR